MARIHGFNVTAPTTGAVPDAAESERRALQARLTTNATVPALYAPGVNFELEGRAFVRRGPDGAPDVALVVSVRTTTMHRAAKPVSAKSALAILRAGGAEDAAARIEKAAAHCAEMLLTPLRAVSDAELLTLARSKKTGEPAPEVAE